LTAVAGSRARLATEGAIPGVEELSAVAELATEGAIAGEEEESIAVVMGALQTG